MVQVLEGEGAIARNRELMGATNPQEADSGTIRADLLNPSTPTLFMVQTRRAPQSRHFFASSEICSR